MKRIFAMAIAACMLLAGCGSPAPVESAPAADAAGSQPAESTAGDNAADPLGDTFTVGMECNYAPFNWTQLEQTDTSVALGDGVSYGDGYDVVMASAIAEKLGKTLVIKKTAWDGLEPALSSGEIDAVIAGMTATPERAKNADFTSPYYESDMVIIIRGDDAELGAVTDIQQLSGKKVQGQKNTNYDTIIDQIEGVQHMTPLDSYPLMINALKSGDVDALTAELPVATGVISTNPDLKIVQFDKDKGFQVDTSVSIAIKKGNTALLDAVQGALDTIPEETRQQWMLDATQRQPATEG